MVRLDEATGAVVTVGDGRGFIIKSPHQRYIITAAHCLPVFPPCHGASYLEERTYEDLLAKLGERPSIWCECLFADPVADIAVLGPPDNQELSERAEGYEALVEAATALTVAAPPSEPIARAVERLAELEKQVGATGFQVRRECPAFLLSLSNEWFPCKVEHDPNGMLNILDAARDIAAGMSGSPIIAKDGTAIGVVCLASSTPTHELETATGGGPNPRLMGNLPGWLLKIL